MARDGVKFGFLDDIVIGWRRHRAAKSVAKRAMLMGETYYLKKKYGVSTKHAFLIKTKIYPLIFLRKVLSGTLYLSRLYSSKQEKYILAFTPVIDCLPKALIRQIIPYL